MIDKLPEGVSLDAVKLIAVEAGRIAQQYRTDGRLSVTEKGPQDRVTQADVAVETFLRNELGALNGDIDFMGEEGGISTASDGRRSDDLWVVDPIDGTENYWRGLDHWSVSVALVHRGRAVLGVVNVPDHCAVYSAQAGCGGWKNGLTLSVSSITEAAQAMIIFGVSNRVDLKTSYLDVIARLNDAGIEHRRFGSAAFSLCQVAQGAAEGYFEGHLNPWDGAAGMLIASEAGAYVAPFDFSKPQGAMACVVVPALKSFFDVGA